MRRKDKEITDRGKIDEIIKGCQVCHLAFAVERSPYVVPVSFGYDGVSLYIHTARAGKKLDFISANPRVCFAMERDVELVTDETDPSKWTFTFESVIGYGDIKELTDSVEMTYGLNQIMHHYSGSNWEIDSSAVSTTRVWRITIDSITGKGSK